MDDRRVAAPPGPSHLNGLTPEPAYMGVRMSADEYLGLADDGFRYELIDGVVVMSPSPKPDHQDVIAEIEFQMRLFLKDQPIGRLYEDIDVQFDEQTVYAPDLVFIARNRMARRPNRIAVVPDLIVEVLSPASERRDATTKRMDYARFGVREYWMIDPRRRSMTFLRLESRGYVKARASRTRYASSAMDGFVLDLTAVRGVMRGR